MTSGGAQGEVVCYTAAAVWVLGWFRVPLFAGIHLFGVYVYVRLH